MKFHEINLSKTLFLFYYFWSMSRELIKTEKDILGAIFLANQIKNDKEYKDYFKDGITLAYEELESFTLNYKKVSKTSFSRFFNISNNPKISFQTLNNIVYWYTNKKYQNFKSYIENHVEEIESAKLISNEELEKLVKITPDDKKTETILEEEKENPQKVSDKVNRSYSGFFYVTVLAIVGVVIGGFYFFNQKGDTSINIDKVETNNDFRQIYPTQNTRFFAEDNAPLVWYASHNNKLDFYNQNEHPVTKEVFEPITREIIKTVFIEENIIPVKVDPKVQVDSTPYLLNTSFKNLPNKKQLSIFIVDSTYQIDRDILDTVKNQCINKGYSITPPLVPFNKLSRNVISQLENLNSEYFKADFQKYTDYLCIGTRQYKYSESPISAGLVVCELSINYSIISTKTSEEIDYYSKIISGTGFSKSKAKQNAIKKHSL